MGILVKHVKKLASGRAAYRRTFPPSLLPFIPGKEHLKWAEHKRSLGPMIGGDFDHALRRAAEAEFEAIVTTARKRQAGQYDALDAPTIAYLAETYHARRSLKAEDTRWHPKNWGGAWGQAMIAQSAAIAVAPEELGRGVGAGAMGTGGPPALGSPASRRGCSDPQHECRPAGGRRPSGPSGGLKRTSGDLRG